MRKREEDLELASPDLLILKGIERDANSQSYCRLVTGSALQFTSQWHSRDLLPTALFQSSSYCPGPEARQCSNSPGNNQGHLLRIYHSTCWVLFKDFMYLPSIIFKQLVSVVCITVFHFYMKKLRPRELRTQPAVTHRNKQWS